MSPDEIREIFSLEELPHDLAPRYNIAPTQPASTSADKQPFYFHRADTKPFALGGVVLGDGGAIVTTAPLPGIAPLHDRMPLVLAKQDWCAWLEGEKPKATLSGFESYPVSTFVNSPKNDGAQCVAAIDAPSSK